MQIEDLGDRTVVPGKRVGSLQLGMSCSEVRALLGPGEPAECQRLAFVRYPALGLELIFTTAVVRDARLIAIGVRGDGPWSGMPRLKDRREDVDSNLGEPTIIGERSLYAGGASVQYDDDGRATALAIIAPFTNELFPRPMAGDTLEPC